MAVSKKLTSTMKCAAVEKGFANLQRHIENIQSFGLQPIVAINSFTLDTEAESKVISDGARN